MTPGLVLFFQIIGGLMLATLAAFVVVMIVVLNFMTRHARIRDEHEYPGDIPRVPDNFPGLRRPPIKRPSPIVMDAMRNVGARR